MFAGFMILFLGTTLLEIDHLAAKISERFSHHGWYYVVYEATLDVFGLLFIVGILPFSWRRCGPNSTVMVERLTALYLFFAIGVTGYLVEGLRIGDKPRDWPWCSPVGACIAKLFGGMAANESFRSLRCVVDSCCDEFRVFRDDPVHAAAAFHHRPHEPVSGYANACLEADHDRGGRGNRCRVRKFRISTGSNC